MKTLNSRILFILLIVNSIKLIACSCNPEPNFKVKEDLNNYDFIAHVKIKSINSYEKRNYDFLIHKITFETIELYKGKKINSLLIMGSHPSLDKWTSCDINEEIGEEWVFFAYLSNNMLMSGMCTRSTKIKELNGYTNIDYANSINLNQKLKNVFNIITPKLTFKGKRVEYYENGEKQLQEFYFFRKLKGKRLIWYPNKQLKSIQHYKNGKKNGIFEWYSQNGNLIKKEKFKKNKRIDTLNRWRNRNLTKLNAKSYSDLYKVDIKKAEKIIQHNNLWKQYVYNKKSVLIYSVEYLLNGDKYTEYTFNCKTKTKVYTKFYLKERTIKNERILKNGRNFTFKTWNKQKKLIELTEYDKNGKFIKKTKFK